MALSQTLLPNIFIDRLDRELIPFHAFSPVTTKPLKYSPLILNLFNHPGAIIFANFTHRRSFLNIMAYNCLRRAATFQLSRFLAFKPQQDFGLQITSQASGGLLIYSAEPPHKKFLHIASTFLTNFLGRRNTPRSYSCL